MITPETPSSPESENDRWKSFSLTHNGEQRFKRVILGNQLPTHFEIDTEVANNLIKKLLIRGDVVISRAKDDDKKKSPPLNVNNADNGTATAGSTLTFDDLEPVQKIEFDPDSARHIIAINFDRIREKSVNESARVRQETEAKLIQEAIDGGLLRIALRETRNVRLKEAIMTMIFFLAVLDYIIFMNAVLSPGPENTPEQITNHFISFFIQAMVYTIQLYSQGMTEAYNELSKREDFRNINANREILKHMKNNIIPPMLINTLLRLIGSIEMLYSHPSFIRPKK
jgi:hypothetical protein